MLSIYELQQKYYAAKDWIQQNCSVFKQLDTTVSRCRIYKFNKLEKQH